MSEVMTSVRDRLGDDGQAHAIMLTLSSTKLEGPVSAQEFVCRQGKGDFCPVAPTFGPLPPGHGGVAIISGR